MGPEVIKSVVIPQIRVISTRIDAATENLALSANPDVDKKAVQNIRSLVLKSVEPVLKTIRPQPDVLDEYKNEFGSLGSVLWAQVQKTRKASAAAVTAAAVTGAQSPSAATMVAKIGPPQGQPPPPPNPQMFNAAGGQRYLLVNNAPPGQPVVVSSQGGANQQRIVHFLQQRNTN